MPTNQSGYDKYARKPFCFVIQDANTQIRQIPSNATLIIDGHSSFNSPTISRAAHGGGNESITYAVLAWRLAAFELPLTHVLIRLLACESSVYAIGLAAALGGYGYNAIAVGGYTETNYQIPGQRTTFPPRFYDQQGNLKQPKPIIWYGSRGQQLPAKPANVQATQTAW
jgi:hypothetical protein